jgi:hypothetical protein
MRKARLCAPTLGWRHVATHKLVVVVVVAMHTWNFCLPSTLVVLCVCDGPTPCVRALDDDVGYSNEFMRRAHKKCTRTRLFFEALAVATHGCGEFLLNFIRGVARTTSLLCFFPIKILTGRINIIDFIRKPCIKKRLLPFYVKEKCCFFAQSMDKLFIRVALCKS